MCLEDVPAQGEFDVDATKLVGLEFNADEQCQAQFGPSAVFCPFNFAIKVNCYTNMYATGIKYHALYVY